MPANAAKVRQVGQHRPVRSAKLTRHCIAQRKRGFSGRYRSKVTGTNGSKRASWVAAQPAWKRSASGTPRLWKETALAKEGDVKEALEIVFRVLLPSASPDMQTRLS